MRDRSRRRTSPQRAAVALLPTNAWASPVQLVGELDIARVEWVVSLLTSLDHAVVTVDLSGLIFIDAAGLGALVRVRHALAAKRQVLELIGARGMVRQVFMLAELGSLLDD